jgi:zinc D-Ala-D-Ala carboxypeptidase
MKLTQNFSLSELTRSQTATRRGIDNQPNDEQLANLVALCECVLQPIRDHFKTSVRISSGLRVPELNAAIGGSTTSDHCTWYGRRYRGAPRRQSRCLPSGS